VSVSVLCFEKQYNNSVYERGECILNLEYSNTFNIINVVSFGHSVRVFLSYLRTISVGLNSVM
jgi:hypothetical protein